MPYHVGMSLQNQAPYIAISFLAALNAASLPVALLSAMPHFTCFAIAKLAAKAFKHSSLSTETAPAIKAGLLTLFAMTLIAGLLTFGFTLGAIYAISLGGAFFQSQKELDKGAEFKLFNQNMI